MKGIALPMMVELFSHQAKEMDVAQVTFPGACGEVLTEKIDPSLPEMRAVEEIMTMAMKYKRRCPKWIVIEMIKRQSALQKVIAPQIEKIFNHSILESN